MCRLVMGVAKSRALLIAAGNMNKTIFQNIISKNKFVVAIDGGYSHCINAGIIPDVIIGDFDSLEESLIDESVLQIFQKSQDETDLVKAINWAASTGIKEIEIIGVELGRSDHILGIYAALSELNQEEMFSIDIKLHLNDFIVKYIPCKKIIKFNFKVKTHLSLFCLSESVVTLKGVKWLLNEEKMNFSTKGIHNYSENEEVEIFVHEGGPALLFIKR